MALTQEDKDWIKNLMAPIKTELKDHIKRTNQNEKQMAFLQWVFPVCFTAAATLITIALAIILK